MKVSVIMANFRGARHIAAAMAAVLQQSHADLELIVSDDASPDNSAAIVRAAMAQDPRVRLINAPVNAGPAAARNRALDVATGDWIAIVDSDDLLHPNRFARLLAAAERLNADIIADDLVFFGDTVSAGGQTLLRTLALCAPLNVSSDLFLAASGQSSDHPPLGYLKPMIRQSLIGGRRYDEALRIGEDYYFVLRLLLAGGRYAVLPDPMYLYRRHSASISHRLTESTAKAMLVAHDRLVAEMEGAVTQQLLQRRGGLLAQLQYEQLLAAIRQRRIMDATALLLRHPGLVLRLGRSLSERLAREATALDERPDAELRLGVGLPQGKTPPLSLPCPPVPEPGEVWAMPPAWTAAALSRLHSRYRLLLTAEDAAGAWAAGMFPAEDAS